MTEDAQSGEFTAEIKLLGEMLREGGKLVTAIGVGPHSTLGQRADAHKEHNQNLKAYALDLMNEHGAPFKGALLDSRIGGHFLQMEKMRAHLAAEDVKDALMARFRRDPVRMCYKIEFLVEYMEGWLTPELSAELFNLAKENIPFKGSETFLFWGLMRMPHLQSEHYQELSRLLAGSHKFDSGFRNWDLPFRFDALSYHPMFFKKVWPQEWKALAESWDVDPALEALVNLNWEGSTEDFFRSVATLGAAA